MTKNVHKLATKSPYKLELRVYGVDACSPQKVQQIHEMLSSIIPKVSGVIGEHQCNGFLSFFIEQTDTDKEDLLKQEIYRVCDYQIPLCQIEIVKVLIE